MPAKRKTKTHDTAVEIDAIATGALSDSERLAALGLKASQVNALLKDEDWRRALLKGAAAVDALALKHLFQLVRGDVKVTEDRFPLRDENGNVTGTRKITRPGPSLQACKFWLELRSESRDIAPHTSIANAGLAGPTPETKAQLMSSILALIKPKDDPFVEDVETGK